jgi:nucleoside-diphosphate-sugar epimerase
MVAESKRIAVVGGAGYLGSTLCAHLVEQGFHVTSIDAQWFGDDSIRPLRCHPEFTSKKVDVHLANEVLPLLRGCNAVIWVAGLVGDPACDLDMEFTYSCNYHSALTLAHICKWLGIARYVFASSCSVYGRSSADATHLTETSPTCPLSCYAQDKLASERALRGMADDFFHPTILRLSTLFGWSNRMRFDLVVNVLTARGCKGEILEISGGGQRRPFLHVRDAAAAFAAVVSSDLSLVSNAVFNVGADANNHRIIDVADLVYSALPSARLKFVSEAKDQRDYDVDFSKIARLLGFKANFSVADGIAEMCQKMTEANGININDPLYSNVKRTQQLLSETWHNGFRPPSMVLGTAGTAA